MKRIIRTLYYDLPRTCFGGFVFPCRNVVMELTYRCNLSCRMCSIMNELAAREKKQKDGELTVEEILGVAAQIPGGSSVTFTGGEIFLRRGIETLIRKTAARLSVTLATNGVLLARYADLVVDAGVRSIGISLDGPPAIHNRIRNLKGAYERIETGIRAVILEKMKRMSRYPLINVNTVILRENYTDLAGMIGRIKGLGIESCTFQVLDPSLRRSGISLKDSFYFGGNPLTGMQKIDPSLLKKSLTDALREGKKQGVAIRFLPEFTVDELVAYYRGEIDLNRWVCRFPWSTLRISPYGDVYPCLNLLVGNVRREKLPALWNNRTYRKFRRDLKRASLFPACTGCCKPVPLKSRAGS